MALDWKKFVDILPENSVSNLLNIVTKSVEPETRKRIVGNTKYAWKKIRSGDPEDLEYGTELLNSVLREVNLREIQAEIAAATFSPEDILGIFKEVARLGLGLASGLATAGDLEDLDL